jgi:diguanylate cyclase
MLFSNLIILAKTEESTKINDTLNELKSIISRQTLLDDLNRALEILRDLLFSDDLKKDKKKSLKKKKGLFDIFSIKKESDIDNELVVDIFKEIISKLKKIIRGDRLKNRIESLENEVVDAKERDAFKRHVKEISFILAEYNEILINEKRDVEFFLKELIGNLIETEKGLIDTLGSQSYLFKANVEFNDNINDDINNITKSFDISKTIDEVKKKVFEKLQNIARKIKEKKEVDKANEETFKEKMSFMQKRLNEIKKEASDIKKKSSKIEKEAVIDHLTKALNRRGYEPKLLEELERLKRYDTPCSFMMLDLDDFKVLNDKYGHSAGDNALVKIGGLIRSSIRKTDLFGRYGGEEFVVILPSTDIERAKNTAEKVREAATKVRFLFQEDRVFITLSGGVTELKKDDTLEDIYQRADKCLYKAKKEGKNCIRF